MDNEKALFTLEFNKILEKLAGYTESEPVKKKILALSPYKDIRDASAAQKETTEAVTQSLRFGSPPVSLSAEDVTVYVKRSEQGGMLYPRELLASARLFYVARRMKAYLADAPEECTLLKSICEEIITAKSVEDRINLCIVSEEEISDEASSELSAIRRKIRSLNAKIKDTLDNMTRSQHYKKFLQDPIVTMRSDRYVIPVKGEYRNEIPGIIHDTSSSGATVFIEPMTVVNSNNEIRDLKNREDREIERILRELSALVADNSHAVFVDYNNISRLDFMFCKAKLSLDMNASEPKLNSNGIINFKKARHPLIDADKVVANDISLGDGYDTLVITGPNTGGKTVTLKTIGLLSLMASSGLHICASDNSSAAVFDSIYADIGDEQSIEQSLSTFSSHMTNIVNIIENAEPNSLVLFDELGAGTDPTEGAALAVAVLEFLRTRGATIVATTHYSELKLFALSTEGVENASCEFDVATLRPTYKLLIGVPGKSNAFAISKRLGLNDDVISRANDILSDEDIKFEDVITELEESREKAQRDSDEAARLKRELSALHDETEKERIKLKENKSRILDEARREAKITVMNAKEEANRIIKDLERMRIESAAGNNVVSEAASLKDKLNKKEESLTTAMERAQKPHHTFVDPPKDLKEGETVKLTDMDQTATVLKVPDKNGNVRVQAGIIKMDVHISALRRVDEDKTKRSAKQQKNAHVFSGIAKNISPEVDVRGQTSEEAWDNVDKFLDDCYLAGITPVTIIHGKGTGVLKKYIRENLRKHRYVKSSRRGNFGEGEDGVTVCELKTD